MLKKKKKNNDRKPRTSRLVFFVFCIRVPLYFPFVISFSIELGKEDDYKIQKRDINSFVSQLVLTSKKKNF